MKKMVRLNHFLFFCLLLLAALHLLTIFGPLPPEVLWDNTLNDRRQVVIAESLTLTVFAAIIPVFRLSYRRIRAKRAYGITLAIQRFLLVYFTLQLLGAFLGKLLVYKLFNIIAYSFLLILTANCCFFTSKARKRPRGGRRPNGNTA